MTKLDAFQFVLKQEIDWHINDIKTISKDDPEMGRWRGFIDGLKQARRLYRLSKKNQKAEK